MRVSIKSTSSTMYCCNFSFLMNIGQPAAMFMSFVGRLNDEEFLSER